MFNLYDYISFSEINFRLASGNFSAGRVEVFYDGVWGTICDDGFGENEARVACRYFGFRYIHYVNPLVTNGLSHPYHLDESTFSFSGIRSDFSFSMKIISGNRKAPDGTPRFAASHLGLLCLPIYHNKDARPIWANTPMPYTPICMAVKTNDNF